MPRGGKRKGAGRPKGTGKFGEATKAGELLNQLLPQPLDEKTLADLEEIRSRIDQFNYEDSIDLNRKLLSKG